MRHKLYNGIFVGILTLGCVMASTSYAADGCPDILDSYCTYNTCTTITEESVSDSCEYESVGYYYNARIVSCENCHGGYEQVKRYSEPVLGCVFEYYVCEQISYDPCQSGYYGDGTNCTPCPPTADGISVSSNTSNNTSVSKCFANKNENGTDSTGTYHYTSECFYK